MRKAIQEKHPGLMTILGTPVGMSLMFTESRVLLGVESLMARGIVALPIHDGLMVAESDQEIAKNLMEEIAQEIVGIPMPVSVKAMISPTYTDVDRKAA